MEKKKRVRNTKPGDVFSVKISDINKKYMQYIVSDLSQLNSDVIRVFKKIYPLESNPDLAEIVTDEVDFYAHCSTRLGLKQGLWRFVGQIPNDFSDIESILFVDLVDHLDEIKKKNNWWIWFANGLRTPCRKLPLNRPVEIGHVLIPESIIERMKTGKWKFKCNVFEMEEFKSRM